MPPAPTHAAGPEEKEGKKEGEVGVSGMHKEPQNEQQKEAAGQATEEGQEEEGESEDVDMNEAARGTCVRAFV
jgi:hypothetical protein